ncbi:amidohydrolase family protein [Chloroflexota bacterium]
MVIDIFTHIVPTRYVAALEKASAAGKLPRYTSDTLWEARVVGMSDVEARIKVKSEYADIKEVISLTGPFLETMAGPEHSPELAMIANDEVAEVIAKHPEIFIAGVAILPLNNIEASLQEIDRAIKDLKLRGIEIGTDVDGKPLDLPEFMPIWERMAQYNMPIFLHPSKNYLVPDYPGEGESKYRLFQAVGWPHSTTMAMLRLVYGGVLEKYPELKFVTHHAGGTIPYLAKRIEGGDRAIMPKPIIEYLKLFYNDTAVRGSTANLMCAHTFFGADHLAFATDFPFGLKHIGATLRSVEEMNIPEGEKDMILEGNARKILGLD